MVESNKDKEIKTEKLKINSDSLIDLDLIFSNPDLKMRKTKIVCTIGPSADKVEDLVKLLDHGMNVARLNFSHGDHNYYR